MISIIAAVANRGVIGGENRLLWHIREDLQRFKRITVGHPVVMGRRTFESLGGPLPGRTNVVITRQKDYPAPGCTVARSLEEAVGLFSPDEEVFVIGGEQVYRAALPLAGRMYLTAVEADYTGDVKFPEWSLQEWRLARSERHERGEAFAHPFTFLDYVRK